MKKNKLFEKIVVFFEKYITGRSATFENFSWVFLVYSHSLENDFDNSEVKGSSKEPVLGAPLHKLLHPNYWPNDPVFSSWVSFTKSAERAGARKFLCIAATSYFVQQQC